ncbi:unnamed protein product [Acanthoscelides obtectus]|uniref:CUE domain-containing protein n=1 Tax=Acanthoscelides obtectus TaxID=200917 RepID=A0A9P0KNI4_ACAOB|nr:unnamed protein product [Acanthoscelides obtectus]CAK1647356.1 SWI/SNF-related matrix-associated actin-dependent regulator of chromatin subfamily A containing DEAD/H box 1 [Acanthoscelides obtectus]
MSEEGAPNLQKLRGFRYQKKPQLSRNLDDSQLDTSPKVSSESGDGMVRKRIISPQVDSDSELETQGTPRPVVITTNSTLNNKYNNARCSKNPSILEKEKQMKFLLEIFPNLEAMKIHDCLSKHSFNTDAAAAELSKTYNKPPPQSGFQQYNQWRQDYEQRQAETKQSQIAMNVLNEQKQSFKRQSSNDEPQVKKRRVKRRRASCDSDDSTGSAGYKDKRVFDSDEDSDVEISDELTGDKKRVLEFFQSATVNELQLMNSCSKKKGEAIIEARPFTGWVDLVNLFI